MNRFVVLFLLLILVSCSSKKDRSEVTLTSDTTVFSGSAMTMTYKVIVGRRLNNEEVDRIDRLITETFHKTDTILNKWNNNSELSQINRLSANSPVVLSPLLLRLFTETDVIVRLSNGRFDPTIEPLQALWKQKIMNRTMPSVEEIATMSPMIGWDKIEITDGKLIKKHSGTQLDFGGIAKGLCIDLICEAIVDGGYSDYYVEWGGEIRAGGKHPEGRPWTVFIARLTDSDPEHAVDILELNNQSIATSGDYLQNWTMINNGKPVTYFHIFDPVEMRPLQVTKNSVASASVLSNSCAFADGLATVAMMFPSNEEAQRWANTITQHYTETQFWLVTRP